MNGLTEIKATPPRIVGVKMSGADVETLSEAARADRLPMSSWMRMVALREARKALKEAANAEKR